MVNFDFYRNEYLGDAIPENDFSGMVKKAQELLEHWKRNYRVGIAGSEAEGMAVCAMAETLYEAAGREGVRTASAGAVSVSYDGQPMALEKALYRKASIYLDFYRGVRA